jgi:hypothetical protein
MKDLSKLLEEKIIDRQDFELLFLMKQPDSYIFTSDLKHHQMLRRESIPRAVRL